MLLALGVLVAAWALSGWVRRYALRRSMVDLPNPRGSHSTPTPRGGGLAIAISGLSGLALAGALGWVPGRAAAALVGGGILVAGIGWADDRGNVPAAARLAVHLLAASWALWWLGALPTLETGLGAVSLGDAGWAVALVGIAGATNIYNFMDGIDGLAGGEAVSVGLLGAVILLAAGHGDLALVPLLIAAASAGFLSWNWAPARLFMGDIGSGLLGFLFGTLAVASENAGALPVLAWLVLFGVFAFDGTATLLRRFLRGEVWYQPHRSHTYQRAVQVGWTHEQVTRAVLLLNLVLAALVWAGERWPALRFPAALVAFGGLAVLFWRVQRTWIARAP
ncbi:MAG: glycosyltransferase family 4 protein [Gemmatimonadales bacterium]|nr:glycosyltransferase family 4 protein [Gemmatimonadales bacterium]